MTHTIFIVFVALSLFTLMRFIHQSWQYEAAVKARPSYFKFWFLAVFNLCRVLILKDIVSFKRAYPTLLNKRAAHS
ncbi:hypothetical protein [Motilimonas pumila]|uniref:Uncharacterized protein n=1 Tax=Motilimonas pumila TaxID=2303987 RepID=A0A418YGF8_9GAMM|nr:hypothetical protein [Motilimonas pumila]RJG48482.1 hypothetical protein D1Z90_08290 [Motilimonas pumila]